MKASSAARKECRRWVLSYLPLLAIALALLLATRHDALAGGTDFSMFYSAGQIVRSGNGAHLYEYAVQLEAQQQFIQHLSYRNGPLLWNHAPFEVVIYAVFSLLPYASAYIAWWIFNQLALVASLILLALAFPDLRRILPYCIALFGVFQPLQIALLDGQDSVLSLFLLSFCLLLLTRNHDAAAGVVLALACYKPQFAIPIFLVLAISRPWRFVYGFFAGGIAVTALSASVIGWRALLGLPQFMVWFSNLPVGISGADPRGMSNVRGVLLQSGLSVSPAVIAVISIGFLLAALAAAKVNANAPVQLHFALAVSVSLLISYHAMMPDLTLLVLPFLLAIQHILSTQSLTSPRGTFALPTFLLLFAAGFGLDRRLVFLSILAFAFAVVVEFMRSTATPPQPPVGAAAIVTLKTCPLTRRRWLRVR